MPHPTRADIAILIRDNTDKNTGWLQFLPAADAILNYWKICEKNEENLKGKKHD